jgi:hypothetical protein
LRFLALCFFTMMLVVLLALVASAAGCGCEVLVCGADPRALAAAPRGAVWLLPPQACVSLGLAADPLDAWQLLPGGPGSPLMPFVRVPAGLLRLDSLFA